MSQSKNTAAPSIEDVRPLENQKEIDNFAHTTEAILQRRLDEDEERTVARLHKLHSLLTPREWVEIAAAVPCRIEDVKAHYDSKAAKLTKYFMNRLGIDLKTKQAAMDALQEAASKSLKKDDDNVQSLPRFEERKLDAAPKKRKASDEVPDVYRDRPAKRQTTASNSPKRQAADDTAAHPPKTNRPVKSARKSRWGPPISHDSTVQLSDDKPMALSSSTTSSSSAESRATSEKATTCSTSPTNTSGQSSSARQSAEVSLAGPECDSEIVRMLKQELAKAKVEVSKLKNDKQMLEHEVTYLKDQVKVLNDDSKPLLHDKRKLQDRVDVLEREVKAGKERNAELYDENDRRDGYWRLFVSDLDKEKEEIQSDLVRHRKRADESGKTVKVLRAALQREGWTAEEIKEGKKLPKLPGATYADPKDALIARLRAQRDQLRDALSNEGWSDEEVDRGVKAYPPKPTPHTTYNAKDTGNKFDQAAVNNACEKYGIQMTLNQFGGGEKTKKWTENIKTVFNHHGARLPPAIVNDNTTAPSK